MNGVSTGSSSAKFCGHCGDPADGGSDIAALLVAAWTGAGEVHLWKDGGGIRLGDRVASVMASEDLLARIGATIHPLHPAAARIAQRRGIALVLEDPWGRHPSTTVPGGHPATAVPVSADPRGVIRAEAAA